MLRLELWTWVRESRGSKEGSVINTEKDMKGWRARRSGEWKHRLPYSMCDSRYKMHYERQIAGGIIIRSATYNREIRGQRTPQWYVLTWSHEGGVWGML